jgi:hypothetical protein
MSLPWNTSSAAPSAQQKVPTRAVPGTIRQVRGATYPPLTAPPGGQQKEKEKVPSPQCAARRVRGGCRACPRPPSHTAQHQLSAAHVT